MQVKIGRKLSITQAISVIGLPALFCSQLRAISFVLFALIYGLNSLILRVNVLRPRLIKRRTLGGAPPCERRAVQSWFTFKFWNSLIENAIFVLSPACLIDPIFLRAFLQWCRKGCYAGAPRVSQVGKSSPIPARPDAIRFKQRQLFS